MERSHQSADGRVRICFEDDVVLQCRQSAGGLFTLLRSKKGVHESMFTELPFNLLLSHDDTRRNTVESNMRRNRIRTKPD
jgi:hypothetical protein